MKLGGYRSDGTLRVLVPGGMTVLLRGDHASPPIDDTQADAFGPWTEPPITLTWQERQNLGKQLDRARTVPLQAFALKFTKKPDADESAAAATVVAAPAEKPLTKGDLLARITEIAQAQKAATETAETPAAETPAAAPADTPADAPVDKPVEAKGPRSTLKRLKLEYESEDREDDKPATPSETAPVPDHLQPMEKRS